MPEPATQNYDELELERRRRLIADLRALRSRLVSEEEKEFWRKFDEELERERLTFR